MFRPSTRRVRCQLFSRLSSRVPPGNFPTTLKLQRTLTENLPTPPSLRRRSRRNDTAPLLRDLAHLIISSTPVLFITGAGLSAASGIRPFRGPDGLWSSVIWKRSTRHEFRKDPLTWYNEFWFKNFPPHTYGEFYEANGGHEAIAMLTNFPNANVKVITQNVDGLHSRTNHRWNYRELLIEAHGRLGFYKCIPEVDSDDDFSLDSDEELEQQQEQRRVKIGSRRKSRALLRASNKSQFGNGSTEDSNLATFVNRNFCKYQFQESIPVSIIEPPHVRRIISGIKSLDDNENDDYKLAKTLQSTFDESGRKTRRQKLESTEQFMPPVRTFINDPPLCPSCHRPCPPQALQFDEGYHSHCHYQFERMENCIESAAAIVFVGTSFAVSLTQCALDHARKENKFVYNFNVDGSVLETSAWGNVENVLGDVQITLPELVKFCEEELMHRYKK